MSSFDSIIHQEYQSLLDKVDNTYNNIQLVHSLLPLSSEVSEMIQSAKLFTRDKDYVQALNILLDSMQKIINFAREFVENNTESTSYNV